MLVKFKEDESWAVLYRFDKYSGKFTGVLNFPVFRF